MGTFSIWHWVIVLVVVLVLFGGRGKLSQLMGDMAKGINAFKKGLKEDSGDGKNTETPKTIENNDGAGEQTAARAPEKDGAAKS